MDAEKEADKAKDILDTLVSRVSELEDEVREKEERIEELEAEVSELEEQIADGECIDTPKPTEKRDTNNNYKIEG